jgi:recombination protein RecR
MNIPSKIVDEAVEQFANLPGIGKRTALRFVLHLLKSEPTELEDVATAIIKLKNNIVYCKK